MDIPEELEGICINIPKDQFGIVTTIKANQETRPILKEDLERLIHALQDQKERRQVPSRQEGQSQ